MNYMLDYVTSWVESIMIQTVLCNCVEVIYCCRNGNSLGLVRSFIVVHCYVVARDLNAIEGHFCIK